MRKLVILLVLTALGSQLVANEVQHQEAVTISVTQPQPITPSLEAAPAKVEAKLASITIKAKEAPVQAPAASSNLSGTKYDWLRAAGIPESDWVYADYIVSHESGWRPCAYYPSKNDCNANPVNACGLVMQNPCHKIPGDWRDPVVALKWQASYVSKRYNGYAGAYNYWLIHKNY